MHLDNRSINFKLKKWFFKTLKSSCKYRYWVCALSSVLILIDTIEKNTFVVHGIKLLWKWKALSGQCNVSSDKLSCSKNI